MPRFLLCVCLLGLSRGHQACSDGADGSCVASGTGGSVLLQRKSKVGRAVLQLEETEETDGNCAAFETWPDVDRVTCPDCTALVLAKPYGGRCDRYCESFGHVCAAAAEERAESCEVLKSHRCDEEISGTSDMLCTCKRPACYGELSALAAEEGREIGGKLVMGFASECKRACDRSDRCQSVSFCPQWDGCWLKDRSFSGSEAVRTRGACKTFFKKPCGGGVAPPTPPAPTLPPSGGAATIRVVTYNLFWWNAFRDNPWKGREVTKNINDNLRPDVLGLQECDSPSLIERRTGYSPASRFSGAQGIMVKPGLFTVGDSGSRDIRASGKWGRRFVTWAQLTHKESGRTFWHFNTHWCVHTGNGQTCSADKRHVGAKNMMQVIREKAGDAPVIITGDFNANRGEPGPRHFLQNGFSLAKWTWVDGVFYSAAHWRKGYTALGESAHSDHRPVIAELELK